MPQDLGSLVQLVSLAGVKGKVGFGLNLERTRGTLAALGTGTVAGANPRRVWCLITNDHDANDMEVSFGETPADPTHTIVAHGHILINYLLPWTGDVRLYSTAGVTYTVSEASVV